MKLRLTLTQRLSLVFAVLLLVCSGTSAWMQLRASRMHELEVVQGLSRDVAESIARDAQLTDANGLMPGAVRSFFNQLMLVNPSVEVYLLDADGRQYATEADRNLLYVAVTRAMHALTVLYRDEPSPFLGEKRLR